MKFTIQAKALKDELGFSNVAVEKRSTIPVLSNILIESISDSTLRITATDLDVTATCEVIADISEQGAICIAGKKLGDVIRTLDGDVTFTKDENEWVRITSGKSKFRLAGVSKDQFPETPKTPARSLTIPAETFNAFVKHSSFCITTEQSRFTQAGAKLEVANGTAKMITTDGHRLVLIASDGIEGTLDALIPKKALNAVKFTSDIDIVEDVHHIFFTSGSRSVCARKLSGNFPNYEMVIPKDNDKEITVNTNDLRLAVQRVALMSDERNQAVNIDISENEMSLSTSSSEEGEGETVVECSYSGEDAKLRFNWKYITEYLSIVTADDVTITFKDANSPSAWKYGENDLYVLMPLRR